MDSTRRASRVYPRRRGDVDAATARAKSSEAAFLSLYRLVREDKRPDPAPILLRCEQLGHAAMASARANHATEIDS